MKLFDKTCGWIGNLLVLVGVAMIAFERLNQ